MKALRHPLVLAVIALLFWSCGTSQNYVYSQGYDEYYYEEDYYDDGYQGGGISFNVFYNELRPYGRWINDRAYGRIWVPNVGRDFHPYATNGYWVMTDYGNTWVSNFSWGWAPFHYGRWYYDDYYGWAWIPGYEWAPAWVTWRSGGGYYGWAPMGPGVNINIHVNIPSRYWTFLPNKYMYYRNMHKHYNRYSPTVYNRTTVINNTYIYNDNRYYSGPSAREYERETGRTATVRRLESNNNRSGRSTRVSNRAVSVYRPDGNSSRTTNTRSSVNGRSTDRSTTGSQTVRNSNRNTRVSEGTTSRSSSTTNRNATVRSSANSSRSSTVTPQNSSRSNNNTTVKSQSSSGRSNSNSTVRSQNSPAGRSSSSSVNTTRNGYSNNRNATTTRSGSSSNNRNSVNTTRSSSSNNRNSTVRSSSGSSSKSNSTTSSSRGNRSESSRSGRSSGRR